MNKTTKVTAPDDLNRFTVLKYRVLLCEHMKTLSGSYKLLKSGDKGCYDLLCSDCSLKSPEEFDIWKASQRLNPTL